MKTFAIFALVVILALAWIIVPQHLARALTFTVYGVPLFLFGAGVVVLAMWAMKTRAGHIKTIAEAREIERRSLVQFHHAGNRIVAWVYGEASGGFQDPTLEAAWRITGGPNPGAVERIYNNMHGRNWRGVELPTSLALPEPEPQAEPILDALLRCKRGRIIGPSDAGKTSTLRFLAEASRAFSNVLVIDPKAYNGKWPGCAVIGQNGNYPEIERAAVALVRMMRDREARMGQGNSEVCPDPDITVIADEWRLIKKYCPNAPGLLMDLITESRGVRMRVYLVNHVDTAGAWGIEGQAGLLDGVEKFILEYDQQTARRRAWLEVSRLGPDRKYRREVKPLIPAGPYYDDNGFGWTIEQPPPPLELSAPEPSPDELRILSLARAGWSLRDIWSELNPGKTWGGPRGKEIQAVIDRWAGWEPGRGTGNGRE